MKTKIISINGEKTKEIVLPDVFESKIRADICQKVYETEKKIQPYAPFYLAGKQYSASGVIKRRRKAWKSGYGKGMSRVPRKAMWRRGSQFYWIGATVSSTVGGRRAHPPRIEHFLKKLKINKKENLLALSSGISASASINFLKKRYETIKDISLPLVIESGVLELKTKEFFLALKKILGENFCLALQKRKIKPGKRKMRGRKYRSNRGLLLVTGKTEEKKIQGIDVKKIYQIKMADLYPLGRLTLYTEKAIEELKNFGREAK